MSEDKKDLVPIVQLTGIYTPAKLKPDRYVDAGSIFPENDNGEWIDHIAKCTVSSLPSGEIVNDHFEVKKLWIVDVYGDKCTIVYKSSYYRSLLCTFDYPLEDLEYNSIKVAKADDGVKTELCGSRYTLGMGYKNTLYVIIACPLLEIVAIAGIVVLRRKGIRSRQ